MTSKTTIDSFTVFVGFLDFFVGLAALGVFMVLRAVAGRIRHGREPRFPAAAGYPLLRRHYSAPSPS